MKKNRSVFVNSIAGVLLAVGYTSAHANVTLFVPATENFCASLAGTNWSGSGNARGPMDCDYKGNGTIYGSAPNYKLQVHVEKSGGNFFCPKSLDATLDATCTNNNITIYNDNVHLNGGFVSSNQINASGKVGFLGITDDLTMTAHMG